MKKSTDLYYVIRNKIYPIQSKLDILCSNKVDFLFLSLLLVLSFICFKDILRSDVILVHGDLRFALTVHEHLFHLLSNLPVHAGKLPLSLILYPLQTIVGDNAAEKVFTILILFLAATLVYFANKLFVRRFEGREGYWLSSSCFIGSLVFVYNPWTLNKIHHHYWLVLSLAASYLLIATIDNYIGSREQKGRKQLLIIAFSTSLVATQLQGIIIYFMPMLIIYLIINLVFNRSAILSKLAIKKITFLTAVTLACSLFWLFPVIEALTIDRISQGFGFVTYEISQGFVTYGIVHENVDQLSRRATIYSALQGTGDWTWGEDSIPDPSIKINNIDLWQTVALLPLIFIFLFFILRRPIGKSMIYIIVFFSALVILSVILATGSHYNDIYKRAFLDFPLGESLRDPYKFTGLYFAVISFFATATLYRLERKSIRKNIAVILLFAGLILSWGWIGLTGNLNGHLTQSLLPYPHDLSDVSEFLHRQYGIGGGANGSIFWYPTGTVRTQLQYSSVPELSTESLPHIRLPPFQLNYINYLINKNDDTSFIRLLEHLGVQYLAIREDYRDNDGNSSPESLQQVRMQMQNLKTSLQENRVFESGRFAIYKLSPMSVSVSHTISIGTDDLSKVAKVAEESEYLNNNIQLGPFLEDSLIVSDLPPPELLENATITVHPTSEHFLPRKYWSTGAINGGWMNTILPYLDSSGIKTWQFDYNKGFIFSLRDISDQMTEDSISIPFKVNNNNNYKVFIRYLESPKGGLISTNLERNLIKINTLSTDSKFVWKDLGEYTLNQGSHSVTFTNREGFNAINAILLIQKDQFEEISERIEDWLNRNNTIIMHIFEAESDMNMINATIVDKISSGNDKIILINGTAWKQFDVKKEGNYRIWIKGSGLFSVIIDDHNEIVNATMNRPTFSDPFKLKQGNSKLEVTPLQELKKLKVSDYQSTSYLVGNTSNSKASDSSNVIDSIWLVSDSDRLYDLFDDDAGIVSSNQTQITTSILYNMWSSSPQYEIQLNNITTTKPLMISIAEPFNPNLKAAIYTKDGLSEVENLIPLFYSLKSGIYLNSLPTDAKIVLYDSEAPIEWFVISGFFFSVASYILLVLSTNVKLANGLKGFVYTLNSHLMKQKSRRNSQ